MSKPVLFVCAGKESISIRRVSQIAKKVLENGGDIEVLDKGGLVRFGPIALIRHY